MASLEGPSLVSDIGVRTGQSRGNVQTYRARLLHEQVIFQARRGYVDFAIPYLRQYLRDHPEHDVDARTVPATWSNEATQIGTGSVGQAPEPQNLLRISREGTSVNADRATYAIGWMT